VIGHCEALLDSWLEILGRYMVAGENSEAIDPSL
jgi:hypothetical protein